MLVFSSLGNMWKMIVQLLLVSNIHFSTQTKLYFNNIMVLEVQIKMTVKVCDLQHCQAVMCINNYT